MLAMNQKSTAKLICLHSSNSIFEIFASCLDSRSLLQPYSRKQKKVLEELLQKQKMGMFCALSQSYQHICFCEKQCEHHEEKCFRNLKMTLKFQQAKRFIRYGSEHYFTCFDQELKNRLAYSKL